MDRSTGISRRMLMRLAGSAAVATIIPAPAAFAARLPAAPDAIDTTLAVVSDHFSVSIADIMSLRRTRTVLPARHVALHLALKISGETPQEVGRRIGGKDQTAVLLADRTMRRLADSDPRHARLVRELERRCRMENHPEILA